jgi:competence protein ComEC
MYRFVATKLHYSWFIAWLSAGVVVGIFLSQYSYQSGFDSFVWPVVGLALFLLTVWKQQFWMVLLAVLAGVIIGLWRGSVTQYQLQNYSQLYGRNIEFKGRISDDLEKNKQGKSIVYLDDISVTGRRLPGQLWLTIDPVKDLRRGDIIVVSGLFDEGFGSFKASVYNGKIIKVKRPMPGDLALEVRDWFADAVRRVITEPEASLGIGFLVGQKGDLPSELEESLRLAGLTHIIVASGYNLTILIRLARRLFVKISKYLTTLVSSSLILCFIAVTGMSPSMNRAGLVAGLSLLAWYYGRKFHPFVLLIFVAAISLMINPNYAWGDLGWQLSFAAFTGVMILAPLLQRYFFGDKKPGLMRQIIGETISAFIVTLPIIVYTFGYFSNVAIIANILILPLLPLAMLLVFLSGILSLAVPAIAWLVAVSAQWLLQYMTFVAGTLAHFDWSITETKISIWAVGATYLTIIFACLYMSYVTKYNLRDSNLID